MPKMAKLARKNWQKVIGQNHFDWKMQLTTFDQMNLAFSRFDKVRCYHFKEEKQRET
jgi:hypothetical protein